MKAVHRIILSILIIATLITVVWIITIAGNYYLTPQIERPHVVVHKLWKPGGVIGHGLGIIGSSMMLILLLYSVRKRFKIFRRWGKLSSWLKYHIFLGIVGPTLVTFHTALKFGGLVSISYWSMAAVALSGFIGRYIYIQIPRRISGEELSLKDVEIQNSEITEKLRKDYDLTEESIEMIRQIAKTEEIQEKGISGIFYIFYSDLTGWYRIRKLYNKLVKIGKYPKDQLHELFRLIKTKVKLSRRKAFWKGAHQLFHYWHVIHRPFAFTMLTIMVIHVIVVITLGYTWILE